MTTSIRNQQIVAARIRRAADALEMAMSELAGAQHDAQTSGIDADLFDALELGIEPEQMDMNLRVMADSIERTGRFNLDD